MAAAPLSSRRRLWGVAAALAVVAVTTAGCVPTGGGGAGGGDLLVLVNDARAAQGLGPLAPCGKLDAAASVHARDMWTNNFNSHTGSDGSSAAVRAQRQGYDWTAVGENIAWGYQTEAAVFDNWIGSSGHRANILNPGFVHHGWARYGDRWVQVFGTGTC